MCLIELGSLIDADWKLSANKNELNGSKMKIMYS
jgi:hypothetical protein